MTFTFEMFVVLACGFSCGIAFTLIALFILLGRAMQGGGR